MLGKPIIAAPIVLILALAGCAVTPPPRVTIEQVVSDFSNPLLCAVTATHDLEFTRRAARGELVKRRYTCTADDLAEGAIQSQRYHAQKERNEQAQREAFIRRGEQFELAGKILQGLAIGTAAALAARPPPPPLAVPGAIQCTITADGRYATCNQQPAPPPPPPPPTSAPLPRLY